MSSELYQQIQQLLAEHVDPSVSASSLERLTLLVIGIIKAEQASPARIAKALDQLGLSQANVESIERRIRRIENDHSLQAASCVHPLARARLQFGRPERLILIIDPTTQDERVVMLTASVWYRGRALPLAWAIWPAQEPFTDVGFWERVAALLQIVAELLPVGVPVVWLADRAFGSPAFTDLLAPFDWDYVVRVQGQTRFRDQQGQEFQLATLVSQPDCRTKGRGQVFKKRGWRWASVVAFWGRRHHSPLCLVTSLPPRWDVIALYRRRYPIEIVFTQMTKTSVSAGLGGWDDVADFDVGIIDDDTVKQQFNQFSLLGKGGLIQPLLDSMAELFNRRCNGANLNLLVDLSL